MEKVLHAQTRTHHQVVLPKGTITFVPRNHHPNSSLWQRLMDTHNRTQQQATTHAATNAKDDSQHVHDDDDNDDDHDDNDDHDNLEDHGDHNDDN